MRARLVHFMKRPAVVAAVSVLILRGLTLSSRFLLSVLLARMLSPAEMGEYGLVTAVLAFALLLVVPMAVIRLVSRWLGTASRNSLLGPFDRLLGFGFGAVKGTIIAVMGFSVLVLGYDTVWGAGGRPGWITQARSYPFINAGSDALVKVLAERRATAAKASQPRVDEE